MSHAHQKKRQRGSLLPGAAFSSDVYGERRPAMRAKREERAHGEACETRAKREAREHGE